MHIHLYDVLRDTEEQEEDINRFIYSPPTKARHEWIMRTGRADILMITVMTRIYNVSYNVTYKLGYFSFYILFSLLI